MQAALRDRATRAGLVNIECVQAGFLSYQHTGSPADAVFTRNALHQVPEFWKAPGDHTLSTQPNNPQVGPCREQRPECR